MQPKPGIRTTEFAAAVLASVAAWVAQWAGTLPPKWAAIVMGLATVGYQLSRGLTKLGAYMVTPPAATSLSTPPTPPAAPPQG